MKMKNLNKKGFTLIELLAVIVILAIILVIAVPSVLNIQKNAKKGTTKDEALMLIKSIELCITSEQSIEKCQATGSNTNIANYYDKLIDGTNINYVLNSETVDSPKFDKFEFTMNGYTISGSATTSNDTTAKITLGNSLAATKASISDSFK